MKKMIAVLLILQMLLVSPFAYADGGDTGPPTDNSFVFPASLQSIDEEAFVGTAAETVIFPEGFSKIGDLAFAYARNLKNAYIPATTNNIGSDSFSHNANLTIHGVEKSIAYQWALENGFAFVNDDIWTKAQASEGFQIESLLALFFIICPVDEECLKRFLRDVYEYLRSMRPQDRPELNPIDYKFP